MTKSPPALPRTWPVTASDLHGLALLGVQATLGVTDVVEAMHHTVLARPGPLARGTATVQPRTQGITGAVYGAVRATTRGVGWGLDKGLGALARRAVAGAVQAEAPANSSAPAREAWLAALNGVWGDHLADIGNPLAITAGWRVNGQALRSDKQGWVGALPRATGRVLVMVHGLCMNDLQFTRAGHNHASGLHALGYTPVHLHYNTGLPVWRNGQALSRLLDELMAHWPVPVKEIVLLGHSMGGLVLRSACLQADASGGAGTHTWRARLKALVCLGTPHHGAPLERGGHLLDRALAFSPYAAPLVRLGASRSAGITDLRFGHIAPAALQGEATAGQAPAQTSQGKDARPSTPWPAGVPVYLVAATTAASATGLRSATLGDGLVPLASALGQHRRQALDLRVPTSHQQVITLANHWDLLNRPEVGVQLQRWLA